MEEGTTEEIQVGSMIFSPTVLGASCVFENLNRVSFPSSIPVRTLAASVNSFEIHKALPI